jgi:multiple sugar transport system permease protein
MARPDSLVARASPLTAERTKPRRSFWSADNPWLWLTPALVFLASYSIFPLIYNIFLSVDKFNTRKKIFEYVGLDNWIQLFTQDTRFANAIGVTLKYVVAGLIVELALGLLIAILLDSRPFGAGIMQALIILPMVTAPTVAGMLFRLLENSQFGLLSYLTYQTGLLTRADPLMGGSGNYALIGVLLVEIWQWTPFFVLIILAGLKGLPIEVMEAAEVDGANWWQRLTGVKIPMLRGVLTVAILFRLVDLFKVFDYIVILTAGGPATKTETLSFYGYANTFLQVNWGYGATIGLFMMVVVWIVAFTYIRIFKVRW